MSRNVTRWTDKEVIEIEGYGEKLKKLRGSKTIDEVAKAVGVSRSAIAMYEAEERIPRDEIKIKLALYYKKSVQYIFFAK